MANADSFNSRADVRDLNASDASRPTRVWPHRIFIVLLISAMGILACFYNHQFYQTGEPTYDSLSYHERVYRAMTLAQSQGVGAALSDVMTGRNTIFLPLFLATLLGNFIEPSRWVGIWIQVLELGIFLWIVEEFLRRRMVLESPQRILVSASFALLSCLHFTHGGLSDFRMDLPLALFYGATSLQYLIARHSLKKADFFIFGVLAGLGCLSRATAPIYFVAGLGPLIIWDFCVSHRRRDWVVGTFLTVATTVGVAGWFFIINFEHLYYYYFVWNTDANAKIPWGMAVLHCEMVNRQLGWSAWVFYMGLCWLRIGPSLYNAQTPVSHSNKAQPASPGLPWIPLLWLGLAPLVLLVGRRMGLNPFVSMPSAFLIHLLIVLSLINGINTARSYLNRRWIGLIFSIGLTIAIGRGYLKHTYPREGLMATHREIVECIAHDARREGRTAVHYGTLQLIDVDTSSLQSVILFDIPEVEQDGLSVSLHGIKMMPARNLNLPAQANWDRVSGKTDQEKIATLAAVALESIDYLIVPDEPTAEQIARIPVDVTVHRHLLSLRTAIVNPATSHSKWVLIPQTFAGKQGRRYQIWRAERDEN